MERTYCSDHKIGIYGLQNLDFQSLNKAHKWIINKTVKEAV